MDRAGTGFLNTLLVLRFSHMDDTGHERMHRAEVRDIAFVVESMLVAVVRIERLGDEAVIAGRDRVRRLVVVDPDDRRPGCDRDLLRHEGELAYVDRGRLRGKEGR